MMNKINLWLALVVSIFNVFLVSAANAWTIEQSYDSSSNGEKCPGWSTSQSVISSNSSASGGKSCKQKITGGEHGYGEWGGIHNFPSKLKKGDEIWVRVRTNFPLDFDYDATPRLKFLRVKTWGNDGKAHGHNDWLIDTKGSSKAFSFIYEGSPGNDGVNEEWWHFVGTKDDKIQKDVWETYEFYIKFDDKSIDQGGLGVMKAWKNGVLLDEMTDRVTLQQPSDYSDRLLIFTYWNNHDDPKGAPKSQSMYIDDLVVTNERPVNTDAHGNYAIGMGDFVPSEPKSAPKPPAIGANN